MTSPRVAIAVAGLLLLPLAQAPERDAASAVALTRSTHVAAAGLTPGLVLPPADNGVRVFAVVMADIDADGDLDVVGGGEGLDLFVWVNDGAGHLTRQQPQRSSGWRSADPGPAFDDHRAASGTASLGAGGVADDRSGTAQMLPAISDRFRGAALFLASAPVRTRRSRAPPTPALT